MTVRTCTIAEGATAAGAGTTVIYTCPANTTAIVKEISIADTTTKTLELLCRRGSGGAARPIWDGSLVAFVAQTFSRYLVLEPGDQLEITQPGGSSATTYWVSGTQLQGVAP